MANEVVITISGKDNFSQTAKQVESSGNGMSSAFKNIGQTAAGVFLGGGALAVAGNVLGKVTGFLGDATAGFQEHKVVVAQTEAVIKSTGSSAGVTADQIESLADSIEKKSLADGDAIQKGANLLLTFTNIKNGVGENEQIFDRATQTMTDMAQAMGTDVAGGAIQLGKALNDPVAGISALSRVGVTFTEDQKKMIEGMVEAGDVAGAQTVILDELNKEFGGSAQAASDAAGSQEKYKDRMAELSDQIGEKMLPIQEKITEAKLAMVNAIVTKVVPILEELYAKHWPAVQKAINDVVAFIETNWPKVEPIFQIVLENTIARIEGFIQVVTSIIDLITHVVDGIDALIHGRWSEAWANFKQIPEDMINIMFGYVKSQFGLLPGLVVDGVKAAINAGIGQINNFINSISGKSIIPSVDLGPLGNSPGVSVPNIPNIPTLSKGGITTGPTLALIGDNPGGREAVIPLDGNNGFGNTYIINVQGSILSDRDLIRLLRDEFNNGGFRSAAA